MSNVWTTLSAIDVSKNIEKKGNLSYLSWAYAWGTLMKYYPDASYCYFEPNIDQNGTVEVEVEMTVDGITRRMWLPVMDNRNKAVVNPTSRDVSDARMRCLVKCIAMFGLGHYIYAGEDLPIPVWENDADKDEYVKQISESFGESNYHEAKKLYRECTERQRAEIWKSLDSQCKVFVKEALSVKEG